MSADPDWLEVRLEEVADEITVGFVGPMAVEYRSSGVPFFRSLNIKPFRVQTEDLKFISPEFHHRIRKSRLKPGDVVIVRTGDPGTATVIPDSFADANCSDLVIVRPSKELNPHFLAYYVNAVAHHQVAAQVVGAVQQHFNVGSAKQLTLTLPPRAEQDSIANVLRIFDRKLELNERMNQTMEALAAALFRSWFVDFDPVVTNAAGRVPFGLDPKVAALFPSTFTDSELGRIPKGWVTTKVGDEVSLTKGVSYRSAELAASEVALVTLKSIERGGGYRVDGLKSFTGRYSVGQIVEPGELVVAQTDVTQAAELIGRAALVVPDDRFKTLVASLDILVVRPHADDLGRCFFYALFGTPDYVAHVVGHANGTTVLHLAKEAVPNFRFTRPSREVALAFRKIAEPWYRRIVHNVREALTLSALRDTLLPKLLSGELRVKDAEKRVAAVV